MGSERKKMGQVRPFTEQEFKLAIQLATDARIAYRVHRYTERDLRVAFDYIRHVIHYPPMTDEHFETLLKELG
jgi:hypothetical protein